MDLYEIERWNGDMKSKGKTWLRISRKGTYAMKKFTVAVLIIGAFILYSLLYAMQTLSRSYQITRRIQAHPAEVPLPVLYRLHPVRQTLLAHPVLFIMINNYADPQLTSETIAAQSANVDIVTGATDTSQAFIQSLSDALSQAKA